MGRTWAKFSTLPAKKKKTTTENLEPQAESELLLSTMGLALGGKTLQWWHFDKPDTRLSAFSACNVTRFACIAFLRDTPRFLDILKGNDVAATQNRQLVNFIVMSWFLSIFSRLLAIPVFGLLVSIDKVLHSLLVLVCCFLGTEFVVHFLGDLVPRFSGFPALKAVKRFAWPASVDSPFLSRRRRRTWSAKFDELRRQQCSRILRRALNSFSSCPFRTIHLALSICILWILCAATEKNRELWRIVVIIKPTSVHGKERARTEADLARCLIFYLLFSDKWW